MTRKFRCSGDAIPSVRLAFAKEMCLRHGQGDRLTNASSVAAFVAQHYGCKPQEVFLVVSLNANSEPIYVHEVSLGAVDQTAIDPRVVFAGALLSGASALILVHNHPSGNPEPSAADVALTKQLVAGAELLSLRILDHLVIARGGAFTSFAAKGLMPGRPAALGDEEMTYAAIAPAIPVVEP